MLFDKAIRSGTLSQSDLAVIDYITRQPEEVLHMSSRELAAASFVSPSTVVRLCKKIGFESYGAMKVALARELSDEDAFEHLDADFPQLASSSVAQVIARVSSLEREAIRKTERLLSSANWEPIVRALDACEGISLYSMGYSTDSLWLFAHDMQRLGKRVSAFDDTSRQREWASTCPRTELGILMSYGGKTREITEIGEILTHRGLKSVAITSDPQGSVARSATWHIPIAQTQTNGAYDRVANIQAHASQCHALNALYSVYISKNYQEVRGTIAAGLERQGVRVDRQEGASSPHLKPVGVDLPVWAKRN